MNAGNEHNPSLVTRMRILLGIDDHPLKTAAGDKFVIGTNELDRMKSKLFLPVNLVVWITWTNKNYAKNQLALFPEQTNIVI